MTDDTTIELAFSSELHEKVIQEAVLNAQRTVWIATADLKDMHIPMARGYQPILEVFDRMVGSGVQFRVIHAAVPSRPFRNTMEKFPRLVQGEFELQICPRSHWKMVIVDGAFGYFGSANFTGAGLGAKKPGRRNLELGAVTDNPTWVRRLEDLFDRFWMGDFCRSCAYHNTCPDPIDNG